MNRKFLLSFFLISAFSITINAQPVLKSYAIYRWLTSTPYLSDSANFTYFGGRTCNIDNLLSTDMQIFIGFREEVVSFDSADCYHRSFYNTPFTNTKLLRWYNSSNKIIKSCTVGSTDTTRYTYNTSGDVTSISNLTTRDTFIYSGSNMVQHSKYTYVSSTWMLTEKIRNTYNSSNDCTYQADSVWNTSSIITNFINRNFTYNSSHQVLSINCVTKGTPNNVTSQYIYYYSSSSLLDSIICQLYYPSTSTWGNYQKKINTYNGSGKIIMSEVKPWNSTVWGSFQKSGMDSLSPTIRSTAQQVFYSSSWHPDDSVTILYYTLPTNIEQQSHTKSFDCTIYPVPASSYIDIAVNQSKEQSLSFAIFNTQGRLITNWSEESSKSTTKRIPLDNLPNGNYVLYINNKQEGLYKQFTISR